jgi:hypothetical protein
VVLLGSQLKLVIFVWHVGSLGLQIAVIAIVLLLVLLLEELLGI